jgi:hypothetical protein
MEVSVKGEVELIFDQSRGVGMVTHRNSGTRTFLLMLKDLNLARVIASLMKVAIMLHHLISAFLGVEILLF